MRVIKRFIEKMRDPNERRLFYAIFGGKMIGLALLMAVVFAVPAYFGSKAWAADAPVPAVRTVEFAFPISTSFAIAWAME